MWGMNNRRWSNINRVTCSTIYLHISIVTTCHTLLSLPAGFSLYNIQQVSSLYDYGKPLLYAPVTHFKDMGILLIYASTLFTLFTTLQQQLQQPIDDFTTSFYYRVSSSDCSSLHALSHNPLHHGQHRSLFTLHTITTIYIPPIAANDNNSSSHVNSLHHMLM